MNNQPLKEEEPGKGIAEKKQSFFSLLIPRKGFFAIPLLIDINLYFFIRTAAYCATFFEPDASKLLECGANYGLLTLTGEWWRLLTCNFLHIGIFHLLVNMYALLCIGLFLEPLAGRWRIFATYLLTGLCSATASLSIHPEAISAGASGAIFGLYGVSLVYLLSRRIEREQRRTLLVSIGIFLLYNLLNGFTHRGIDNAAHIGGLASGCLLGAFYLLADRLAKSKQQKRLYPRIGEAAVGLLVVLSFAYARHASPYSLPSGSSAPQTDARPQIPLSRPLQDSDVWLPFADEATGFSCRYPSNWQVMEGNRTFCIVNGISRMTVTCLTAESESEFNHIRKTTPIIPQDEYGKPSEDYRHELVTVNGYAMDKVENPQHIAMQGTAGIDVTQTAYYYFDKPRLRYFAIVTMATDDAMKKELADILESIRFE